jgi:hypothetical protein
LTREQELLKGSGNESFPQRKVLKTVGFQRAPHGERVRLSLSRYK